MKLIFMAHRSSSESLICSLNKKEMPAILSPTTQHTKTVTRSARANRASILCRTSRLLAVEPGPGPGSAAEEEALKQFFVNKGLLKQRANPMKLNTPSCVYCWLPGEGGYRRG